MSNKENTLNSDEIRVLIDTSFLLPTLRIDTDKEVLEAIKYFKAIKVFYLEISLMEAMWSIIKKIPSEKMDLINDGILAIRETYNLISPPASAYISAWKMYKSVHKDFIDNLLYATSRELKLLLLTIDRALIDKLAKNKYPTDNIIEPAELAKILKFRNKNI
ncbi:MAG: PIN domain-containing protein [Candidatus Odinarchaeota archaeon]|nr:PIN domain-containing protein [Candidatus Odinarchaeota archaeon]